MREPSALAQRLSNRLQPFLQAPAWHLALSGGLDSTVLLHLLASVPNRPALTAIHIHHGLQAVADTWPAHCQALCDQLDVPLQVIKVRVQDGASLEQAARQARYRAFDALLGAADVLFAAQHQDDQAETVLFRLLRGAGVRGLAAMPRQRPQGQGILVRPLLDEPRAELLAYARNHGLQWIEDPSNTDTRFSRNYLRGEVLPVITARWPQAAGSIARAAAHLSEAAQLLDELAAADLAPAHAAGEPSWLALPSLTLAPLRTLSESRQRNALQYWLAALTRLPDTQHWVGWTSLRDADPAATPVWRLADGELHRAHGRIWWVSGQWSQAQPPSQGWPDTRQALQLVGNGEVHWQGGPLPGHAQIRYRQGGERLRLPVRGERDLKRLLNESRLPGFVRDRLPLLFIHDRLVAVANLPLSAIEGRLLWSPTTGEQSLR
ncbi:tRNA lysidine(34) synthetase TilS [Pseudomonas sp. CFBP 8771]|uniref:tRNA lysidine(34) synthetase TilS n=1 Tax=Pseudomonas sp. CFBP 8771 TaxID=2775285 RepID=UPI001782866E|nr:tRNA lysidine(34) synthetase TilS [Pseudomonas sp. CFBP 8771]MBD8604781.1 tRNA lysidine(34) synthetase TilS [Pseudomonas sp. CFBP 8771]